MSISQALQESPEGGYPARALGTAIFTEADSLPELRVQMRDAVLCHYDDEDRPQVIRLHFAYDEVIAV